MGKPENYASTCTNKCKRLFFPGGLRTRLVSPDIGLLLFPAKEARGLCWVFKSPVFVILEVFDETGGVFPMFFAHSGLGVT